IGFHDSSSVSLWSAIVSSASSTGDEITYAPLAHLPRSIRRQRSLQKGKSASADFTGFLQIGQRSLMGWLRDIVGSQKSDCRGGNISALGDFDLCNLTSDLKRFPPLNHNRVPL